MLATPGPLRMEGAYSSLAGTTQCAGCANCLAFLFFCSPLRLDFPGRIVLDVHRAQAAASGECTQRLTVSAYQRSPFDAFINEFNTEWPHEALNMKVPAEIYTPLCKTL